MGVATLVAVIMKVEMIKFVQMVIGHLLSNGNTLKKQNMMFLCIFPYHL
jgi:hypothetical protein